MYYASNAYFSAKTRSSALIKVYLWYINEGNASWTVNKRQGHRQGKKLASGKLQIDLIILIKKFISQYLIQRVALTH